MKKLLILTSGRRLSVSLAGLFTVVVLCAAVAAKVEQMREDALSQWYQDTGFADPAALLKDFKNAQMDLIPLVPPGMPYVTFSGGIRQVVWENFPKKFINGLVAEAKGEALVYPVTVFEDGETRERVFVNAKGREFYSVRADSYYDPTWILKIRMPDLYATYRTTSEMDTLKWQYDPARVVMSYKLAGADAIAELVSAQSATPVPLDPPMMLMGGGPSITNIQFTALERDSNGWMQVEISYPTDYTNRLDIFSVDGGSGLIDFWWDLRETTNVNTSTNFITWTDTTISNATDDVRFYAAANADLNNDTDPDDDDLTWGREQFLYHTSPTNSDTDADGYDDYEEVIEMGTDPNNDDTNPPTIFIDLPSNNTERIWLP